MPGSVPSKEQQKQIDAQTKRVVSLFKRQLAIPLLGNIYKNKFYLLYRGGGGLHSWSYLFMYSSFHVHFFTPTVHRYGFFTFFHALKLILLLFSLPLGTN